MKTCNEVAQEIIELLKQNKMSMYPEHNHWDGWYIKIEGKDNEYECIQDDKIMPIE